MQQYLRSTGAALCSLWPSDGATVRSTCKCLQKLPQNSNYSQSHLHSFTGIHTRIHTHIHTSTHTLSAACNQRLMQIVRQTRISEFLPIFSSSASHSHSCSLSLSLPLALSVAVCLAFSLVFVMYFIRHVNMPSAYVYQRNFWKKKLNFPNGIWYTRQTEQRTHTHTHTHAATPTPAASKCDRYFSILWA